MVFITYNPAQDLKNWIRIKNKYPDDFTHAPERHGCPSSAEALLRREDKPVDEWLNVKRRSVRGSAHGTPFGEKGATAVKSWGSTITEHYPFDRDIELNKDNFARIVKTIDPEKIRVFNKQAEQLKQEWLRKEDEIINKIIKYLNMPFEKFDFKVSLTTAYLIPYDYQDKWFMVPTHKGIDEQIECVIHELFHLYQLNRNPTTLRDELEQEVEKFLSLCN